MFFSSNIYVFRLDLVRKEWHLMHPRQKKQADKVGVGNVKKLEDKNRWCNHYLRRQWMPSIEKRMIWMKGKGF